MSEKTKTPWRKNLDKRYISGEDLKNGIELGKGLRPEMVVTLAKFSDAPAFDQKLQKEVDKTALYLLEYPSGKPLYKPVLMNVANADFLAKELANNSLYIDDADTTKPFVLYAQADKRHGFVARFKKYYPPQLKPMPADKLQQAIDSVKEGKTTLEAIKKHYTLTAEQLKAFEI